MIDLSLSRACSPNGSGPDDQRGMHAHRAGRSAVADHYVVVWWNVERQTPALPRRDVLCFATFYTYFRMLDIFLAAALIALGHRHGLGRDDKCQNWSDIIFFLKVIFRKRS